MIVLLVPVIVPVTVSVAVSVWVPAVLEGDAGEGVGAVVAADEGVVGGQGRAGAVAAGEVDRAGVAGGDVAVGVLGRHRDAERRRRRSALAGAADGEASLAAAALTVIVPLVPVMVPVTVSVAVTTAAAGGLEGDGVVKVWAPLSPPMKV